MPHSRVRTPPKPQKVSPSAIAIIWRSKPKPLIASLQREQVTSTISRIIFLIIANNFVLLKVVRASRLPLYTENGNNLVILRGN